MMIMIMTTMMVYVGGGDYDGGGGNKSKPRGDPASNGALLANAFSSGIGVMVGISSSSLILWLE